jgi:hypothetical protein
MLRRFALPLAVVVLLALPWGLHKTGCVIGAASGVVLALGDVDRAWETAGVGLTPRAEARAAAEALRARVALGCWGLLLIGLALARLPWARLAPLRAPAEALALGALSTLLILHRFGGLLQELAGAPVSLALCALPLFGAGAALALALSGRGAIARDALRATALAMGLAALVSLGEVGSLYGATAGCVLCAAALWGVGGRVGWEAGEAVRRASIDAFGAEASAEPAPSTTP